MGNIGWLAIIGVVAIAAYLWWAKQKSEIEALADQLKAQDPGLTNTEALATAAAQLANAALVIAQNAEAQAGLDQAAQNVVQSEDTAGTAQTIAISDPTPDNITAAQDAAQQAADDRKRLEELWRGSLATAEKELERAKAAAEEGKKAYDEQAAICCWRDPIHVCGDINYGAGHRINAEHNGGDYPTMPFNDMDGRRVNNDAISSVWFHVHSKHKAPTGWRITLYEHSYFSGASLTLTDSHPDLRQMAFGGGAQWWQGGLLMGILGGKTWNDITSSMKVDDSEARRILNSVRIAALEACTAANLVVERVLTMLADLRLLEILITEAERIDKIALAVANKVAEIETALGKPVEPGPTEPDEHITTYPPELFTTSQAP